jgi:CspA family cold shock protein
VSSEYPGAEPRSFSRSEQPERRLPHGYWNWKWFNETKGYGFIQPDQGGKDVFVHISAVERSGMNGLAEGMKVTYDVEADRKSGKESATNLKVA